MDGNIQLDWGAACSPVDPWILEAHGCSGATRATVCPAETRTKGASGAPVRRPTRSRHKQHKGRRELRPVPCHAAHRPYSGFSIAKAGPTVQNSRQRYVATPLVWTAFRPQPNGSPGQNLSAAGTIGEQPIERSAVTIDKQPFVLRYIGFVPHWAARRIQALFSILALTVRELDTGVEGPLLSQLRGRQRPASLASDMCQMESHARKTTVGTTPQHDEEPSVDVPLRPERQASLSQGQVFAIACWIKTLSFGPGCPPFLSGRLAGRAY